MRAFGAISMAVMLVCGYLWVNSQAEAQEAKEAAGAKELIGRYELVAGEKDGEPIPAERIKGSTMRIAENAITAMDKDHKEIYAATYELDTSKEPWHLRMTAKVAPEKRGEGSATSGLIEKKGDTVRLIYSLPGGQAPDDFKAGEKQQLFVLKRVGD